MENEIEIIAQKANNGIGIIEFFDEKNILVTGATGFLAKEEMHGESYKLFILSKLVPVVGNIHEPNLGMDIITAHKIAQEIDLIVDSAAITTFDERYDLALDANVNGPCLTHDVCQEMQETYTSYALFHRQQTDKIRVLKRKEGAAFPVLYVENEAANQEIEAEVVAATSDREVVAVTTEIAASLDLLATQSEVTKRIDDDLRAVKAAEEVVERWK
ncbi:hypothetical protein RND71_038975 [Anisodus tanguticus]|uniref:Fatty acyl-CoA reductase n=1 Tax=Anisodus tanguticus TaxID=243964 RepID=A0AAE1R1R3_9SOLA|nr:hypothetical protein RND71_038975 [Anisodus tanguticus]